MNGRCHRYSCTNDHRSTRAGGEAEAQRSDQKCPARHNDHRKQDVVGLRDHHRSGKNEPGKSHDQSWYLPLNNREGEKETNAELPHSCESRVKSYGIWPLERAPSSDHHNPEHKGDPGCHYHHDWGRSPCQSPEQNKEQRDGEVELLLDPE